MIRCEAYEELAGHVICFMFSAMVNAISIWKFCFRFERSFACERRSILVSMKQVRTCLSALQAQDEANHRTNQRMQKLMSQT